MTRRTNKGFLLFTFMLLQPFEGDEEGEYDDDDDDGEEQEVFETGEGEIG